MAEVTLSQEDIFSALVALAATWTPHEDIRETERREAIRLGKALHELGGTALMRDAYYHARSHNRTASVLNLYWNGIGEWLA